MLALTAPETARVSLRAVRDRNPELFTQISERITALREEPEVKDQGRAFRLEDGRTARLALYYDAVERIELALVWMIEEFDGVGTLHLVALDPVG